MIADTSSRSNSSRANLATVLALADSRLPTGGHVHSGGVEEAIALGYVKDVPTLDAFLRRRIRTSGAVTASIAAALVAGILDTESADAECDARTPSPATRSASRAQGRGLLRLAKASWPDHDWVRVGRRPHLSVVSGHVAIAASVTVEDAASVQVYTSMTGSAIAAQRLLALDPAAVAACTVRLACVCDRVADDVVAALPSVIDLSDPLMDIFAEAHVLRDRPLFVS